MTEIFSTIASDIATTKNLKALSDRARDAEFKNPVADARLKDKTRDWADGELGRPKSRASKAPVEMHETIAALLRAWRHETPYSKDSDFVFPSFKLHGKQPRLGSMIAQDYIRPAAVATGVIAEVCPRFGFYNLGHGLSTFLIENGHDPVVVQRLLRQSHVDMTMHYVHNSCKARNAQAQFIERFLPNDDTVTDVEGPCDEKRVPVRVQ
jgi:integrase